MEETLKDAERVFNLQTAVIAAYAATRADTIDPECVLATALKLTPGLDPSATEQDEMLKSIALIHEQAGKG